MVDWMIEVLTNFKCDDLTFFLATSMMDRYFKNCPQVLQVNDLHVIGVTTMFLASKYEDIYPLKMKTVFEKIGHGKLEINTIKKLELDIMKVIDYKIHAPTVLDFLKVYLYDVLGIAIESRTETNRKEEAVLQYNGHKPVSSPPSGKPLKCDEEMVEKYLIEKMAIYLSKMSNHDIELAARRPSLLAVGSIYVALKICEQLKKKELINSSIVTKLIAACKS